jgi:hypothetical protein
MAGIKSVRRLLLKMTKCCHCATLDQCGRGIFRSGSFIPAGSRLPHRRSHC